MKVFLNNTIIKHIVRSFVLLALFSGSVIASEEFSKNLIYNGKFLQKKVNGKIPGWGVGFYDKGKGTVRIITGENDLGNILVIENTSEEKGLVQVASKSVRLPSDRVERKIKVSFKYKGLGSLSLRFSRSEGGKYMPMKTAAGKKIWLGAVLKPSEE